MPTAMQMFTYVTTVLYVSVHCHHQEHDEVPQQQLDHFVDRLEDAH